MNHLGDDTVAILDSAPERIYAVPRLKRSLADHLIETWPKKRGERNIHIYLQGLGISARIAQRIVNEYGSHTQQIIENNPYQLAQDVFTIGFRKADQIAGRMGLLPDDPHRLRAGLHHALGELAREGHTYAPRDELLEKAGELLAVDDPSALTIALQGQLMESKLVEDKLPNAGESGPVRLGALVARTINRAVNAIYLPRFFRAETASSQMLRAISSSTSVIVRDHRKTDWARYLSKLGESNDISLSPQQIKRRAGGSDLQGQCAHRRTGHGQDHDAANAH